MKIFFITKKLVGVAVMPLQFSLLLIVLGIVLLWLNRGRRLGQYLMTGGTLLLLIFSNSFVGYHLVHDFEARYRPLRLAQVDGARDAAVQAPKDCGQSDGTITGLGQNPLIVVLSGGASNDPELPVTDRLTPDSALRVVAAVEIYRSLKSSASGPAKPGQTPKEAKQGPTTAPRILILGGPTVTKVPEAVPMEKLAEALGVPENAILMETRSEDTASEAKNTLPIVGHKPFILVTSAFHMPRSMALFQHLGMRPIPAPSNYAGRWTSKPFVLDILPTAGALVQSETAWHERLGMIWEHLRGQL
jgi:uncharacterized SAM-binding protein YcdF (DUF218 family)